MFCTPVSGSFVMYCDSVVYGALSQPGVEIGTGIASRPMPGLSRSSPMITISWQGAFSTIRGGIGLVAALFHVASIWSSSQPMPIR